MRNWVKIRVKQNRWSWWNRKLQDHGDHGHDHQKCSLPKHIELVYSTNCIVFQFNLFLISYLMMFLNCIVCLTFFASFKYSLDLSFNVFYCIQCYFFFSFKFLVALVFLPLSCHVLPTRKEDSKSDSFELSLGIHSAYPFYYFKYFIATFAFILVRMRIVLSDCVVTAGRELCWMSRRHS